MGFFHAFPPSRNLIITSSLSGNMSWARDQKLVQSTLPDCCLMYENVCSKTDIWLFPYIEFYPCAARFCSARSTRTSSASTRTTTRATSSPHVHVSSVCQQCPMVSSSRAGWRTWGHSRSVLTQHRSRR